MAGSDDGLKFLDTPDAHWTAHADGWKREERRLYGGDPVLTELTRFSGEEDDSFALRVRTARYLNFPELHTSILAGHLLRAMPIPSFGQMGEVRGRNQIGGSAPTLAEMFWYNCDGIGSDGSQFPAWANGVIKRSCATGYRWLMVEMPNADTLAQIRMTGGRTPSATQLTQEDMIAGFRPWLVERSPLSATRRRIRNGVLEYILFKVPLLSEDPDSPETAVGSYLLVRQGVTALGTQFEPGGWWMFDEDHNLLDQGDWAATFGNIPVVRAVSETSSGTWEAPALARSLTMELGQIGVDVMNARSEQRYNARQAAKSINWLLGADPDAQKVAAQQSLAGSILVGVPPVPNPDGSFAIPQMWNSSAAALDTGVYTAIIQEAVDEAREIMVRQITSEPGSSGESKMAGFEEANSPLLARLSASVETWINSLLYFYALRGGIPNPDPSVQMPRDFDLRQVVDDVDAMLDTLRRSGVSSPTWEQRLIVRKGDQLGLIPDEDRKVILAELEEGAAKKLERQDQEAQLLGMVGGSPLPGGNGSPPRKVPGNVAASQ